MTDTASVDAAPAHDRASLDETATTAPPEPETTVKGSKPSLSPIDTTAPQNNFFDSDSSSDLTPIKSDDEDDLLLEQSLFQNASSSPVNATNGHSHETGIDDRPTKRQRLSTPPQDSAKKKKSLAESPPWKKFEADRPTTFTEDGKRRSGRTNLVPVEQQPQGKKRLTRGAFHGQKGTPTSKGKPVASVNGHAKAAPSSKAVTPKAPTSAAKSATKKLPTSTRTSARRRSSPSPPAQLSPKRITARQRSLRNLREAADIRSRDPFQESPDARSTRIRLRVRSTAIPIVHPAQVNVPPGQTLARPKLGETFADYVEKAPRIDIKDGGWQDLVDDGPIYTEEQAEKDAKILLKAEEEMQPGGLLSAERCALLVPDPAEEPPRQWAHLDHMVKAVGNFRKLMLQEQQRHRATAKRLAEACRDEWIRRQPKSAEQIEAEARIQWIARYRTVAKALIGTWENVRLEINRRRLEEWEAAEQKRVKAALNEAVNMSELKLQARRAHFDSEAFSSDEEEDLEDEEEEDDDISDDDVLDGQLEDEMTSKGMGSESDPDSASESADNDDNMSSSSDDEEDTKSDISDAHLTQEQLREKYANIPDFPSVKQEEPSVAGNEGDDVPTPTLNEDETSDESVDMDDDLGSSDEGMDSDEDDGSEVEDESDDDEDVPSSGLLGMLFGKSEIKKMKEEATAAPIDETPAPIDETAETTTPNNDIEMSDAPPLVNGHSPALSNGHEDPSVEEKPPAATEAMHELTKVDDVQKSTLPPKPDDVEMEVEDAVNSTNHAEGSTIATTGENGQPAAIPSVEITAPTDTVHTSPGTDGVTNSVSREPSQSPRTPDTKPSSDVETASLAAKTGISRSASPAGQVPRTELPFLLRGTLREYQHYGLDWLAGLYKNKTNGILADEMGLGKTIQTISLLAHLACHHEVWGPHLVIVPTSVMLNWEMEFKKWCPGFKVLSYYGSIEERKRKRQGWKTDDMWNVCITSYQIVLQDHQVFKRRQWHYMILDEAHNIKNFKSKRWQTLLGFNTRARLLLTGTPLQNNLTELWSLLFFLMPSENGVGGFADLAEFQDWFHKPESQILESGREQMDDEARAIIAKLHKVLRPYLLRRLKKDVEKQMPAKYEHVEFCRLSRRQRELYDGFLARTDTREALASGNYISVINCLMQLRKVCNHPDLFVERPIMTSFRQRSSVIGDYGTTNHLVKHKLLAPKLMGMVSLGFLNLIPTSYENLSATDCERISQLSSHQALMKLRETQKTRAQSAYANLDPSTVESNLVYLESASRWGRFEELQHCVYLNALRRQQRPIYGKRLTEFLTIGVNERPLKPRPRVPAKIMAWFEEDSPVLRSMVLDLDQRAASMKSTIAKFACITPAVITRDTDQFVLGSTGVNAFREEDLRLSAPVRFAPFMPKEAPLDPWHEARMRLSIQFPDKRLLQYDCGKLQALDRLLRKLQSGGHRALIFTQMTKVLDILEQFLNIHGHKYLRLDGATKVEQRQILTDRFNNDTRILAFILSTRSGGLGINLTGADTVIFYDQDWNPAMDKQCQDRCHRIGQTRDVHIYRLVSEHTIEANILRKASQKQMLDDIVIQEGGFTTDYFNKVSVHDVMKEVGDGMVEDVVGDAMDRVLGGAESGGERAVGRVLEQAEDKEDVAAAHVAEKEIQEDEADFDEKAPTNPASGGSSTRQGTPTTRDASAGPGRSNLGLYEQSADETEIEHNAWGERIHNIDEFMLATMAKMLEGTALELPKDKKKGKNKKGKDHRKR
ncbi:SNF2 family N-terminal domain-containing protein [Xylariales sp. PMI_506]|nr:SNF2 family N-terminal domain-containing protein [Xylariales sp. PMI_506]